MGLCQSFGDQVSQPGKLWVRPCTFEKCPSRSQEAALASNHLNFLNSGSLTPSSTKLTWQQT